MLIIFSIPEILYLRIVILMQNNFRSKNTKIYSNLTNYHTFFIKISVVYLATENTMGLDKFYYGLTERKDAEFFLGSSRLLTEQITRFLKKKDLQNLSRTSWMKLVGFYQKSRQGVLGFPHL